MKPRKHKRKIPHRKSRNLAAIPPARRPRRTAGIEELRAFMRSFVESFRVVPTDSHKEEKERQSYWPERVLQLRTQAIKLLGLDVEILEKLFHARASASLRHDVAMFEELNDLYVKMARYHNVNYDQVVASLVANELLGG